VTDSRICLLPGYVLLFVHGLFYGNGKKHEDWNVVTGEFFLIVGGDFCF
jgi:hypothetical protein